VQRGWALPFYSTFAIPVAVLALLLVTRSVLQGSRILRQDAAAE
jgi:heme exporter protein D